MKFYYTKHLFKAASFDIYFRTIAKRSAGVFFCGERECFQGARSKWHLLLICLTSDISTRKFTFPTTILYALRCGLLSSASSRSLPARKASEGVKVPIPCSFTE